MEHLFALDNNSISRRQFQFEKNIYQNNKQQYATIFSLIVL